MKCANCNLCLDIYNLEVDGLNKLFWFCDLCKRVYKLNGGRRFEITDTEELNSIRDRILQKRKQINYG
jgi:hypothetical protein